MRLIDSMRRNPTLHDEVLKDSLLADGFAHLEASEVPMWIGECGDHDIAGEACEALTALEGKPRDHVNALLIEVCSFGEAMPAARIVQLATVLQAMLTQHCVAQAQRYVEREVA